MLRYREIKLALQEMISVMDNGDKLPSRTKLIRQLDSSRATIDKAIRELTEEGILESKFGSGTYVARRMEGVKKNIRNWCLIVPDIAESVYAKLAVSVEQAAKEWNANVILCNSESSAEKQSEYIRRLIMAGIDGFIIIPVVTKNVMESVGLYQNLIRSKIPFVFCNRDVEGVTAPIVKSNDFFGGYIATLHLLKQGYRDIAYLAAPRYRTSVDRCQGYVSALQHRGIEINRKRILMLEENVTGQCYDKLIALLKTDIPIEAVFCFNESISFEAIRAVEDMNQRVSEDIGIIGYDDTLNYENRKVLLTTVSSKIEDVGRMAAKVLGKMVEKQEMDAFAYYLMEPSVVVRESCLGRKITKEIDH